MNPKDAIEVVNHASAMSDRWLFLAAIVIILVGAAAIIRYLVNQNESQRQAHALLMERQTTSYTAMLEKVLNVVFEATAVLKDVKETLEEGNGKRGAR